MSAYLLANAHLRTPLSADKADGSVVPSPGLSAINLQLPASSLLATAPKRGRSSHCASDLPECRPASLGTPAPHSTGATVVTGCAGGPLSAPVEIFTRPAPFDGSGDEPGIPSFADGGAKMRGSATCRAGRADVSSGESDAQAKQVATNSAQKQEA